MRKVSGRIPRSMTPTVRDSLLAGALCGAIGVFSAAVLLGASRSPDPTEAAGVFPPWWSRQAVLSAAGRAGVIRDLGAVPFIVVIHDPAGQAQARLRAAGALFSVGPAGSFACGS